VSRARRPAAGGARCDGDGPHLLVVIDALHRGTIEDHPHVGIRHESLETVSTARHHESPSLSHCLLHRRYDFICRVDRPDIIRMRAESLVEALIYYPAISRIVGTDSSGRDGLNPLNRSQKASVTSKIPQTGIEPVQVYRLREVRKNEINERTNHRPRRYDQTKCG